MWILSSRQQEVFHSVNENLGRFKLIDIGHLHINSSIIAVLHSVPGQMVIRSYNIRGIVLRGAENNFLDRVGQEVDAVYKKEVVNGKLVSD